MQLSNIQENAKDLSVKHGWDKESMETRIDYMKSEFKEVLDEVYFLLREKDVTKLEELKTRLGHEMFDLIWNICDLANRFGIDLDKASEDKMEINKNRSFSKEPKKGLVHVASPAEVSN